MEERDSKPRFGRVIGGSDLPDSGDDASTVDPSAGGPAAEISAGNVADADQPIENVSRAESGCQRTGVTPE